MELKQTDNIKIIQKAHELVYSGCDINRINLTVKASILEGVSEKDYKKIDNKLKAIRQDYSKIIVTMNSIRSIYEGYKENTYKMPYFSIGSHPAIEELGCCMEYMFVKYRGILEYIQDILEIVIPVRFSKEQLNMYNDLKNSCEKYNYILKYISDEIEDEYGIISLDWFQKLRKDRNSIIHRGASCMVLENKEKLQFQVWQVDQLEREVEYPDLSYIDTNGFFDYSIFWSVYISNLIVFFECLMGFVVQGQKMLPENKYFLKCNYSEVEKGYKMFEDDDIREKKDVLVEMLSYTKQLCEKYPNIKL